MVQQKTGDHGYRVPLIKATLVINRGTWLRSLASQSTCGHLEITLDAESPVFFTRWQSSRVDQLFGIQNIP